MPDKDQEQKLDESIQSKNAALFRINRELNDAQDKSDKRMEELTQLVKEKEAEVVKKLSEFEKRIAKPDKFLAVVHQEQASREKELDSWQLELNAIQNAIQEAENALHEKEMAVTEETENLRVAWQEFAGSFIDILRTERIILTKRGEAITRRNELLNTQINRVNDQYRTLQVASKEILEKNNG